MRVPGPKPDSAPPDRLGDDGNRHDLQAVQPPHIRDPDRANGVREGDQGQGRREREPQPGRGPPPE